MYSFLTGLFNDLDKSNKIKTQKEETNEKKTNLYDTAEELYNDSLEIYFYKNKAPSDVKKKKVG